MYLQLTLATLNFFKHSLTMGFIKKKGCLFYITIKKHTTATRSQFMISHRRLHGKTNSHMISILIQLLCDKDH